MNLRKGEPWGEPGPRPPDAIVCDSDAAAADVVNERRVAGAELPVIALTGGDLCRTLGGGRRPIDRPDATRALVDIGRADLDDGPHWFVAHCISRRRWWHGPFVVVMNAAFVGTANAAPRAHPGDGRFDVIEGRLSWSDRWKARSRLASGTHVPHPGLNQRRVSLGRWEFDRPMPMWLDGRATPPSGNLTVTVEPDALRVVV